MTTVPQPTPGTQHKKVAAIDTLEGRTVLEPILERKKAAGRRGKKVCRTIAYTAMVALPASLYFFGPQLWTYFIPFMMFLWFTDDKPAGLTKEEYYSVPGSRDAGGKHVCIYCSSKVVERHYYGRSNVEVIYCADCEKKLY